MTDPSSHLSMNLPESVIAGRFADFVSIWHTNDYFVFDFAALAAPPASGQTAEGQSVQVLQAQVVTRVRVLPAQVIEIMKALGNQLDQWEKATGIAPPPE